jgi:hypothetical protein
MSPIPDNPGASPPLLLAALAPASTPSATISTTPSASTYVAALALCLPFVNVFIVTYPDLAVPVCRVLLETVLALAILYWFEWIGSYEIMRER